MTDSEGDSSMSRARLLHAHQPARRRQVRWVVPMLALLAAATLTTLVVQYRVSDQTVGTAFPKRRGRVHVVHEYVNAR